MRSSPPSGPLRAPSDAKHGVNVPPSAQQRQLIITRWGSSGNRQCFSDTLATPLETNSALSMDSDPRGIPPSPRGGPRTPDTDLGTQLPHASTPSSPLEPASCRQPSLTTPLTPAQRSAAMAAGGYFSRQASLTGDALTHLPHHHPSCPDGIIGAAVSRTAMGTEETSAHAASSTSSAAPTTRAVSPRGRDEPEGGADSPLLPAPVSGRPEGRAALEEATHHHNCQSPPFTALTTAGFSAFPKSPTESEEEEPPPHRYSQRDREREPPRHPVVSSITADTHAARQGHGPSPRNAAQKVGGLSAGHEEGPGGLPELDASEGGDSSVGRGIGVGLPPVFDPLRRSDSVRVQWHHSTLDEDNLYSESGASNTSGERRVDLSSGFRHEEEDASHGMRNTAAAPVNEASMSVLPADAPDGDEAEKRAHEAASLRMDEVLRRTALFKGVRLRWLLFFLIVLIAVLVIIFFFQFLHFTNQTILATGKNSVFEKASNVLGNTELLIIDLITFFTNIQRLRYHDLIIEELCTRLSHSPLAFAMYDGTTFQMQKEWRCPGHLDTRFEHFVPAMSSASSAVQIVNHSPSSVLAFMRPWNVELASNTPSSFDSDGSPVPPIMRRAIDGSLGEAEGLATSTSAASPTTALPLPQDMRGNAGPSGDLIFAVLLDKNMVGRLLLSNFDALYSAATLTGTYETFVARQWNSSHLAVLLHTLTRSTSTYNTVAGDLQDTLLQTFQSTCGEKDYVWHTVLHVTSNYSLFATRQAIPTPRLQYGAAMGLLSSVTLCSVVCIEEDFGHDASNTTLLQTTCDVDDPTNFWFVVDVEEFGQRYGMIIILVIGIVSIAIFSGVMGIVYLSVVVPVGFMRHQLFYTVGAQKRLPKWKKNLYQCSYPFWIGDISSLTNSLHVLGISFNLNKKYVPDHILRKHAMEMDRMCRKFKALDLFDPMMEESTAVDDPDDEDAGELADLTEIVNLNMQDGAHRDPHESSAPAEFNTGPESRSMMEGPVPRNMASMRSASPPLEYSHSALPQGKTGALVNSTSAPFGGSVAAGSLGGSMAGSPGGCSVFSDVGPLPTPHASVARDRRSSLSNSNMERPVSPFDSSGTGVHHRLSPSLGLAGEAYSRDQSFTTQGRQPQRPLHPTAEVDLGVSHAADRRYHERLAFSAAEGQMIVKRTEDATILAVKLESIDKVYLMNYAVASRQHRRIMRYLLARIRHWGGAVFHRSGDCLAAAWNAFDTCPGHAARAVACGVEMVEAFAAYRSVGLLVGVVVHAGTFICGIIEDAKEAFSTAFGAATKEAMQVADLVATQRSFGLIVSEGIRQAVAGLYESIIVDVVKKESDVHPIVLFELSRRRPAATDPQLPQRTPAQQEFLVQYAKLFSSFVQHDFKMCLHLVERAREIAPPEARVHLHRIAALSSFFDANPTEAPPNPYHRLFPSWSNYERRALQPPPEHSAAMGGHHHHHMSSSMPQRSRPHATPGRQDSNPARGAGRAAMDGEERLAPRSVCSAQAASSSAIAPEAVAAAVVAERAVDRSARHRAAPNRWKDKKGRNGADAAGKKKDPAGNTRDADGRLVPLTRAAVLHHSLQLEPGPGGISSDEQLGPLGMPVPSFSMLSNSSTSGGSTRDLTIFTAPPPAVRMDEEEGLQDFRRELQDNIRRVGAGAAPSSPTPSPTPEASSLGNGVVTKTTASLQSAAGGVPAPSAPPPTAPEASSPAPGPSTGSPPLDDPVAERKQDPSVISALHHPQLVVNLGDSNRKSSVPGMTPTSTSASGPQSTLLATAMERHADPSALNMNAARVAAEAGGEKNRTTDSFSLHSSQPPSSSSSQEERRNGADAAGGAGAVRSPTSPPEDKDAEDLVMDPKNAVTCSIIQSIGLTLHNSFNGCNVNPSGTNPAGSGSARCNGLPSPLPTQILAKNGIVYQRSDKILGSGSFGSVFLGMDVRSGKLVAIKVLPLPTKEGDGSSVEAEALIMRIKDPHVVEFISYAFQDHSIVIIMECMLAGSLYNMLVSFRALPSFTARTFIRDVLRGLNKLHSMGVIHRDVKPQNVLLTPAGNCKITDFGASAELAKQAHGQSVHGTPVYLAPEAARGQSRKASDLWSCGIMYIQLVTGELPYATDKLALPAEVLVFQIGAGLAVPVIPSSLDELEKDFVVACLQVDADKRPSAIRLLQSPMFAL